MNQVICSQCQSDLWQVYLNMDGTLTIRSRCGATMQNMRWGEKEEEPETEIHDCPNSSCKHQWLQEIDKPVHCPRCGSGHSTINRNLYSRKLRVRNEKDSQDKNP